MMLPVLTREDLKRISASKGFPQVSIHTPMERVDAPFHKNRVLLKNAITEARKKLRANDLDEQTANDLLQPVIDLATDESLTLRQLGGMSIFANRDGHERVELPFPCGTQIEVGERASLLPLVEPTFGNFEYAVLTLSLGGAGLYRTSRFGAELVELPGLPEDLAYVLRFDDFEKSVHPHSTDSGGRASVIHGHGTGKDERRNFVDRFVNAVDTEVTPWLERHALPLVLMGTPRVVGHYMYKTHYRDVVEPAVHVDPFTLRLNDIMSRSWEIIMTRVDAARAEAIDRYHAARSKSENFHTVLPALTEGRVPTLLVNPAEDIRGSYDPATGQVHLGDAREAQTGENLVNVAVIEALHSGAEIMVTDGQLPHTAAIMY